MIFLLMPCGTNINTCATNSQPDSSNEEPFEVPTRDTPDLEVNVKHLQILISSQTRTHLEQTIQRL